MASMGVGGVLTWALDAQISQRSKQEGTDLDTVLGSDLSAAMSRRLGRAPGDPHQVHLPPVSCLRLCAFLVGLCSALFLHLQWVCKLQLLVWDSAAASKASGWLLRVTKAAMGLAGRVQGSSPVALGVGAGAAARAEGQARSASLQPKPGAASR